MAPKKETIEFYSRYKGLGIMFKRPVGRPDGTTDPGYEVKFQNSVFKTDDPEVIEFLKERTIDGRKTIGVDYWLTSDMEKYIKQVPAADQHDAAIRVRDDKITKLEAALKAATEKTKA